MPVPPGAAQQAAAFGPVMPLPFKAPPRAAEPSPAPVPRRRDPARDVRMFAAYEPVVEAQKYFDSVARGQRLRRTHRIPRSTPFPDAPHASLRAPLAAPVNHVAVADRWWDAPAAVGALLLAAPPVGVAIVWTSRRYGHEARIALTIMAFATMCLAAAIVLVLAVLRYA